MTNNNLLSAKNLSVRFGGVLAVNNVSFDVKQGEVSTLAREGQRNLTPDAAGSPGDDGDVVGEEHDRAVL